MIQILPTMLLALCLADTTPSAAPSAAPVSSPLPAEGASPAPRRVLREDEKPVARPSRSVTAQALEAQIGAPRDPRDPGATDAGCLFAVREPEPRAFAVHDLVTIVISESSKSKSSSDAKAEKSYDMTAAVDAWINMDPFSFGSGDGVQMSPGDLPEFGVSGDKRFKGKGNYARSDTFTARVTAEIVEVRPNGLLVVEARREIVNDGESQVILLSGVCRPEDIDASNQIQSQRVADAVVKKTTTGELRDTAEKGVLAKILDTIFAF